MNKSTEITRGALPPIEFNVTDEALAELRKECKTFTVVPENTESYKALTCQIGRVRELWIQVESRRKELNAPLLAYKKDLDSEAKRIDLILKEMVGPLKDLKGEADKEKARIKAEKDAANQRRILNLEAALDKIRKYPIDSIGKSSDELSDVLYEVNNLDVQDGSYEEFTTRAMMAKEDTLIALQKMLHVRMALDEEQKRQQEEREAAQEREKAAEDQRKAEQKERDRIESERLEDERLEMLAFTEKEAEKAETLQQKLKELEERDAKITKAEDRFREEEEAAAQKERDRLQKLQDEEDQKKREREAAEERRSQQEYQQKLEPELAALRTYIDSLIGVAIPELQLDEPLDILGPLMVALEAAQTNFQRLAPQYGPRRQGKS